MTKERRELFNQLHDDLKASKGVALVCATFNNSKSAGGDESEVVLIGAGSVPDLAKLIASAAKENEHVRMALTLATLEML
ncbi:MAG: hypothetical protein MUF12_09205 [Sediminibacterium sp.]|nr:hypothetical protein [Sediminibacterium sp.]